MSIEWFNKKPGEGLIKDCEDGGVMLVTGEPDWITLPAELGGQRVRILRTFSAPCPVRGCVVKHYELDGGYGVAESDQFYWYETRKFHHEER